MQNVQLNKKNSLFFPKEWDQDLLYSTIPRVNRTVWCTLKYVKRIDLVKFSCYTRNIQKEHREIWWDDGWIYLVPRLWW